MTTPVKACSWADEGVGLGEIRPPRLLRDSDRSDPFNDAPKPITELIGQRRVTGRLEVLRHAVAGLADADTQQLIGGLAAISDPLLLWATHLELDRRDIPPCLRWPTNRKTLQADFITWLADIYWLATRNPTHQAAYRGWRDLLKQVPATAKWHAHALRQFQYAYGRPSFSHWCATGLGLKAEQRQQLMTMPDAAMQAQRRAIRPAARAELDSALFAYAVTHPDRSGKCLSGQISRRRASLYQTHVLANMSATRAARYWTLLTGEKLSRQAITKQLEAVEMARRA